MVVVEYDDCQRRLTARSEQRNNSFYCQVWSLCKERGALEYNMLLLYLEPLVNQHSSAHHSSSRFHTHSASVCSSDCDKPVIIVACCAQHDTACRQLCTHRTFARGNNIPHRNAGTRFCFYAQGAPHTSSWRVALCRTTAPFRQLAVVISLLPSLVWSL